MATHKFYTCIRGGYIDPFKVTRELLLRFERPVNRTRTPQNESRERFRRKNNNNMAYILPFKFQSIELLLSCLFIFCRFPLVSSAHCLLIFVCRCVEVAFCSFARWYVHFCLLHVHPSFTDSSLSVCLSVCMSVCLSSRFHY